jgi:hypothetical protein
MNVILPHVRHFLLCNDARRHPRNPHKVDVHGLVSTIRFARDQEFPCQLSLCVDAVMTGGHGTGEGRIGIVDADAAEETYTGHPFRIHADPNPLKAQGLIVRLASCSFPKPGLYWVELRYNDYVIAQEPLVVEQAS